MLARFERWGGNMIGILQKTFHVRPDSVKIQMRRAQP